MAKQRNAALDRNWMAANTKQKRISFIESAYRVKLELIRLIGWWLMAWGG